MKNTPFTTIKESKELIELGFPKWTASCKYILTGYVKDTMMIVSGRVDQDDQIPSWTPSDLMESIPPLLCNGKESAKLKISIEYGTWRVSYGNLFKTNHLELKEALLSTIRYIFKKYKIRTRQEIFDIFFKKDQKMVFLTDEEYAFYISHISEKLRELSKTHKFLLLYHIVVSKTPKEQLGWLARLEVDKEKVSNLLVKGGVMGNAWIAEKDLIMLDSTSNEFINTFVESRGEALIIDEKRPIEPGVTIVLR